MPSASGGSSGRVRLQLWSLYSAARRVAGSAAMSSSNVSRVAELGSVSSGGSERIRTPAATLVWVFLH